MILFTTKTKIPEFTKPRLDGVSLNLAPSVKYLGVVLDPKLKWKLNIEERTRKACVALYSCRKMVGKKWGLKPRMVLWMYTAIVRPILTYGSLVWWPALKKEYIRTKLGSVQRGACVSVTGALRSTPSDALNALLYLLPVDLHIKCLASCSAVRLKENGYWLSKPYGHSSILSSVDYDLPEYTDYTISRLEIEKKFKVKFPTRRDWKSETPLSEMDTVVYTDGSKMDCGVGAGVYSESLKIEHSFRLPDKSSVFQAEMLAIWKACQLIRNDISPKRNIAIATDSQAAILALNSATISSKLVKKCSDELAHIGNQYSVSLLWVPGHRDIPGNERADELARVGSSLAAAQAERVDTPLNSVKRDIHLHFLSLANSRWRNLTTCRTTRKTWPSYDRNRTDNLVKLSRWNVARTVAVFTGHWPIGEHAARLGIPFNQSCRSCKEQSEKETILHFTCKCPALAKARRDTLGNHQFSDPSDLAAKLPADMVRYLNATKWI